MRYLLIFPAALALAAIRAAAVPGVPALHLDHVPIAVRDLQSAVAEFGALGFTVKPGRPHQHGIENASVKFADGSYLELITAHDASDRISREYEELLRQQEGAAYVFLRDRAAGTFTSQVLQSGGRREEAGPFAFTVLPVGWQAPHLQLIQYLAPAADAAATYRHANGARRVVAIWTLVDRPAAPVAQAFGARRSDAGRFWFEDRETDGAALADGTCLMFSPRGAKAPRRSAAIAILLEVDSLDPLTRLRHLPARGPSAWLEPDQMHGVRLGFIERAAWTGLRCPG